MFCIHDLGHTILLRRYIGSVFNFLDLLDACKRCGSDVLSYFSNLKDSTTLSIADCTKVRESLNQINAIAEVRS